MKIDIEFNSGAQLPMDAIPELARQAEAHGFDCAWGGEANNKDPTVMLSAIAAVTRRLKVGSAIYHILGRTPATLALQAMGLDELTGGRFLLGIGSSNPTIAKWHGQTFDHPLGRVRVDGGPLPCDDQQPRMRGGGAHAGPLSAPLRRLARQARPAGGHLASTAHGDSA
jgi:hypothetical protein